jgi:hypothetical protein
MISYTTAKLPRKLAENWVPGKVHKYAMFKFPDYRSPLTSATNLYQTWFPRILLILSLIRRTATI